jgi:ABC-type Fe3+ transport system substrate-binding protein
MSGARSLVRWLALLAWFIVSHRAWPESKVVVLTPHPEEVRNEFGRGFASWHRSKFGAEAVVEWRDQGGSGEDQRFVESEFKSKPDGIGIDVFFGGGPEPFIAFAERKLLEHRMPSPEILKAIPPDSNGVKLYDAQGGWFGACLATFGVLENRAVQSMASLRPARRWEDLADPKCLGWVGAGDPRNSGTMNNMYEAFLQAYGWEKGWALLLKIAGNVREFDRFSTTTAKECALGQVAYAFAIDYFAFVQIAAAGASNMDFVLPEDFTAITPDGIAVLKGAPNAELAAHFLDFVLSEEGQKLWYLAKGAAGGPTQYTLQRLPVRPDLYVRYHEQSPVQVDPFKLARDFRYDTRLAGRRRSLVRSLFGSIIIDSHPELKKAWRRLVEKGLPEAEVAEFQKMPLTEAEAEALIAAGWALPSAAETRQHRITEWQNQAREKYRRLAAL